MILVLFTAVARSRHWRAGWPPGIPRPEMIERIYAVFPDEDLKRAA